MLSLITDYICHAYWHISQLVYKTKTHLDYRFHIKACRRARERLDYIRNNSKYQKEYEKATGRSAVNRHGKLSAWYKEWLEENKSE
jgi:hypothetical protein